MKKVFGLLLITALTANIYAQKQPSLPINASLPDAGYQLSDVLGNKATTLHDIKTGNGLLVIFTCNTCPFVIKNQERTKEILAYAKKNDIGVLLVNSNEAQRDDADSPESMKAYATAQGYPNYYTDKDSKLADAFGASHTPEVFLFSGKTERLVYKGAMDDSPSDPKSAKNIYLKDAMAKMLSGTTIDPAETKSVGCSIKRVK